MLEIQGIIQDIIYKNDENGYTIATFESEEEVLTIVGNMPLASSGENISVEGEFVVHKSYGEQFKVNNYKIIPPKTLKGIVKYLSSGIVSGIGQKTAEKIVGKFGENSLDIIQYSPVRLKEVEGIGKKTIEKISASFEEQREMREVIVYLQGFDISPNMGVKIYKKYGSEAIEKINENPYRLAEEIRGIGFVMSDTIAKNMGVSRDSAYRVKAGIKYVLSKAVLEGHTYMPENILVQRSVEILGLSDEFVERGIMELMLSQEVHVEEYEGVRCVYSIAYYMAESGVAKKIVELSQAEKKNLDVNLREEIENIETGTSMKFAKKQIEAIKQSIENGIAVITGGPGTGKTTTINSIIEIFEKNGMEVVLAAPTGRAAKRMSEATGREAKTIHRLLEYSYGDESIGMFFGRDEGAPVEADVIILDEVSMVDIVLMNSFLKAVVPGTRVILVGDIDQLPSVGAGNVLRDIIDSKAVKVVRLDEIFRQAKESMIVVNAHRINSGESPVLNKKGKDFFFLRESTPEKVIETIVELARYRLPNFDGYDSFRDIQVLTCSRKGEVGVSVLNRKLQEALNPSKGLKKEKKSQDSVYRVGDKVMQIKNNYNTKWKKYSRMRVEEGEGVFNGDMGYITDIDDGESELVVVFDDGREVIYSYSQLDELTLAYAITVHKSQGSEFPVVIMPILWNAPMLMTRNLLYTAITRAKQLVVLVGIEKYMHQMISNDNITERYSGLKRRLEKINEFKVG